jgi:hypothetical protein
LGYIPHHQYTASLMRSVTSERAKVAHSSQVAGCEAHKRTMGREAVQFYSCS